MYDIKELRKKIDQIDSELLPLFLKRMEVSGMVADFKRENGLPVLDRKREKEILTNKMEKVNDEQKIPVRDFFAEVMRISRAFQTKVLSNPDNKELILKDFEKSPLKNDPTVAYQGIPGANSETALLSFFGEDTKKVNVMTFSEVLDKIDSGEADYGVLPIENSSTGSISGVFDLLEKRNFYIVGEVAVDIHHALIGLSGAELRDIRKVYSHEQGYMQCKEFFSKYPKMTFEPYHNTAMAAKMILGLGDNSNAAIADERTAELYGLKVLASNISSIDVNITRFVVLSKKGSLDENHNKISTIFTLPDESGALSNILLAFSENGINLVKIESRPSHDGNFEYLFFVDFEGNLLDENVKNTLEIVSHSAKSLKVLGNYHAPQKG